MQRINIIGAGLAGCESANFLAKLGYDVHLYEQKPIHFSPAHSTENFAELVCSNSFKSEEKTTASGMLKNELRVLKSLCMSAAEIAKVPAGMSMAVDRDVFSQEVTNQIKNFSNCTIHNEEIKTLDLSIPTILATGPLTSDSLSNHIAQLFGEQNLSFYDASAPIVEHDSIDFSHAYFANRYDKGETGDFVNCPLNKQEYFNFYQSLITAPTAKLHEFEKNDVYEGCMPVEVLAKRGIDALRFGPMKPVGLLDPKTKQMPYAVLQLRKENLQSLSYNLVGFQTNLTFTAQNEVYHLIPALKNATFLRYGIMHRNSYLNAPKILTEYFQSKQYPNLFVVGQISGVEGYIESMASGLMGAVEMHCYLQNKPFISFTCNTIMGGLAAYISQSGGNNFQPMGCNLGLLKPLDEKAVNKQEKGNLLAIRSEQTMQHILSLLA